MSDCKIYPADTVDIYGNVWPTVGENIRNGMFGKLKVAKININGGNINSSELKISNIEEFGFTIDKKGIFIFVDEVESGPVSLRIVYYKSECRIMATYTLQDIIADVTMLYMEF